jgi:hypothetical protein
MKIITLKSRKGATRLKKEQDVKRQTGSVPILNLEK